MKDGASIKVNRLQQIAKAIAGSVQLNKQQGIDGVRIDEISLYAQCEIGLSNRKAREYIDLVLRSHPTWRNENETIFIGGKEEE